MRISRQTRKYLYNHWKSENKPNYRVDYREKDPNLRTIELAVKAIIILLILKLIIITTEFIYKVYY